MPVRFLALALVFLVGFRVGLNLTNSNVIDVGYSGVIGADRLTHGEDLYGSFPDDNGSGDTYGPVNYYAYVPFELAFPWSGQVGRPAGRARGGDRVRPRHDAGAVLRRPAAAPRAGRATGSGWCSRTAGPPIPYTLFVLNSNANDSLVALLVTLAFLVLVVAACAGRGAGARRRGEVRAARARAAVGDATTAAGCATRSPSRSRSAPSTVLRVAARCCRTAACASCGTARSASSSAATRRSASGARRTLGWRRTS